MPTTIITEKQLSEAFSVLRARSFALDDAVEARMKDESKLERDVDLIASEVKNLQAAVDAVTKVNGDVSIFKSALNVQQGQLAEAQRKLKAVKEELHFLREAMKHMNAAYESMHCGMIAESQLVNMYRRQQNA